MLLSGAVAGLVGMPHAARRAPTRYSHRLPGRPRLHRHRDRPARPQQPGRHRVRRAAVGLPRQLAPDPRPATTSPRRSSRSCRASSCSRSSSPTSSSAATASRQQQRRVGRQLRSAEPAPTRGGAGMSDRTPVTDRQAPRRRSGSRGPRSPTVLLIARGRARAARRSSALITGARRPDLRPARCRRALALAVPIGLAGLGGLWSERAGVVNIGLEGMMILGTWGGGWAGYQWGPWAGVARRHRRRARSAACCTRSPRSPSASTTSSPVSRSTSSASASTQYLSGARVRPASRAAARPQSPPIGRHRRRVAVPGIGDWLATLEQAPLVPGLRPRRRPARGLITERLAAHDPRRAAARR